MDLRLDLETSTLGPPWVARAFAPVLADDFSRGVKDALGGDPRRLAIPVTGP